MSANAQQLSVRQRFELALRAGRVGTWRWDIASGVLDWDASMQELFGFAEGTFDGSYDSYATRLHPEDRPRMELALANALAARTPEYTVEHRIVLPDGTERWFASTARLSLDREGAPAEMIGVAVDITERRRAELERGAAQDAEDLARSAVHAAQRRMEMLARASSLLDAPLDLDVVLKQVADLAIGEIADWCVVDVLGDGRLHHAAVAHRDPAMVAVANELQERYPSDPRNPLLLELLRTKEPLFVPELDQATVDASATDAEHLALLRSLQLTSYLVVPLVAEGRGVGSMLLVSSHGRHLSEEDVDLAMELGRRAGASIGKARLHDDLQHLAQTLQASLLPPALPDIPQLTLSAHYRSGTRGIDIGGDYYDVFRTGTDRWWMVLGDVCGKGPAAAALAAAVRYSLHAIAPDTDDPQVALRRLNDILLAGDWGARFTTLVIATFTAGPVTTVQPVPPVPLVLRVVSGGHPPALVRRAGGEIEVVACPGTLIGLLRELDLTDATVTLAPGDTLLLYTDGATEARDANGVELGQATLAELFAAATADGERIAPELGKALMDRAGGRLRDDLALLTLTR